MNLRPLALCLLGMPLALVGQQTFPTPVAAVHALAAAVGNNDTAAMQRLFGPNGDRIVSSGDSAEDQADRRQFAQKYEQMHRLVHEPDGTTMLYVGAENWPFPVPLTDHGGQWSFDTAAGQQEILYRRIGRNENDVIATCAQLVAAQKQYYARHHQYAQHFISGFGQQDGLFWNTATDGQESPIGPLLAFASTESTAKTHQTPTPFQGYFYHVLRTSNPQDFAFIAYPASYRSSGVMTFIVNRDGHILEKDLGPDTATLALHMAAYAPNATWKSADQ